MIHSELCGTSATSAKEEAQVPLIMPSATPVQLTGFSDVISESSMSSLSQYRLKRCASTPVLPITSTPVGFQPISTESSVQIPIVGYEVMEERARFTVYKIKIDKGSAGESWFIFRRYTDFVRLNSKLKSEFLNRSLVLPRKRWFGNNFSLHFIEERIQGLQRFIDSVTSDKELMASQTVRDFFCLDEPPSMSDVGEESRALVEALEDTVYQLRRQLQARELELLNLRSAVTTAQESAVTVSQRLKEVTLCETCGEKIQNMMDDLQRALCLQFSNISS